MKDRIFSGIILIIFFLAIIVFNRSFPLALNIAIALISALAVMYQRFDRPSALMTSYTASAEPRDCGARAVL